jgi:hypothetical protein
MKGVTTSSFQDSFGVTLWQMSGYTNRRVVTRLKPAGVRVTASTYANTAIARATAAPIASTSPFG